MNQRVAFPIRKLVATLEAVTNNVLYSIEINEELIGINDLVGKNVFLKYQNLMTCANCNNMLFKKDYAGHCGKCFFKLAKLDRCMMHPEKCHFHKGSCREKQWGIDNCFTPHFVYLSNTGGGGKVGITRNDLLPGRWIDQGATQALPIFKVANRRDVGLLETIFKKHIKDGTQYRTMLSAKPKDLDLYSIAAQLKEKAGLLLENFEESRRLTSPDAAKDDLYKQNDHFFLDSLPNEKIVNLNYPIIEYLKTTDMNYLKFSNTEKIGGRLLGIKGQYMIFDTGVFSFNRNLSHYVTMETD